VVLNGSSKNKSKAAVTGSGTALPALSLPISGPMTVQLVNGDSGLCWGTDYSAAEIQQIGAEELKAKAP
jgi:hypothetical protein